MSVWRADPLGPQLLNLVKVIDRATGTEHVVCHLHRVPIVRFSAMTTKTGCRKI
jgi:hypothetical protein